jgi:hypothetical protein
MLKKIPAALCVLGLVLASGGLAVAQEQPEMTVEEFVQLMRTELKKDKVAIIGTAMEFTGDEAASFWPVYKEYEAERDGIADLRLGLIKDYAASYETMTDEKANELAGRALELEGRRFELKKKYYQKLAKEMSPVVAARFLQVENQLNLIIDLELSQSLPLIARSE